MATRMHIDDENFANVIAVEGGMSALHGSARDIMELFDNYLCNYTEDVGKPFTIADFGTADGSVFVPLLNEMIKTFRMKKGKEKEIMVIFEDQPKNDFNALFKVILGLGENGQKLYMDEKVFAFVNASNMYSQCLPTNSVDFVFSSMATHYLSELPCKIKNGIVLENADEVEYNMFRNIAEKDWTNFVLSRGKELKPGGKFVVVDLAKDMDGKVSHSLHGGFGSLTPIAQQMLTNNIITKLEYESMTYAAYMERTKEDFSKVFEGNDDINKLGLQLESISYHTVVYIPGLSDAEKLDMHRRSEYGAKVANFHRLWLYNTIYEGLSKNRRSDGRCTVADFYFKQLEEFISNAETYPDVEAVYAIIVISKRNNIYIRKS